MLNVKKISISSISPKEVGALLTENGVEWHQIGCVDWKDTYPYTPQVSFRIAHIGHAILLEYQVEEEYVRALADDGGNVWEDSCCEMFLSLPDTDTYYNIECNCAAHLLIEHGAGRGSRERAALTNLKEVARWSSLGSNLFDKKPAEGIWKMALIIPTSAFFKHQIGNLHGMRMRGNFYKCGDKLPQPHFLSWQEIHTESPDFHCPEFFGELHFE